MEIRKKSEGFGLKTKTNFLYFHCQVIFHVLRKNISSSMGHPLENPNEEDSG